MIPASTNQLFSARTGYQISRSVRLRSSASAYFNRNTWTSANRTTWTASIWLKRGILSSSQTIMGSYDGVSASASKLYFTAGNELAFDFGGAAANTITTSAVFRDPSAWYHIVLLIDTTQATAANRIGIYVNGIQQTTTGTPVAQNTNTLFWVTSNNVFFGLRSADYLDGYLAEINVINGQALTPSSFGETNLVTGVWQPKRYTGTYGTNGFYLNFSDNSAATAAAIGKDYSGNGNNWTPNNINVSAYTGTPPNNTSYDSMLDVPTQWPDGGNGRGNYCTLNPLKNNASLTSGNLDIAGPTTGGNYSAFCTHATNSTPIYYEATIKNYNSGSIGFAGFAKPQVAIVTTLTGTTGSFGFRPSNSTWTSYLNSTSTSLTGLSGAVTNDVLMVAFNPSTGKAWIGKNGTWYNSGNPAADTNPTLSGIETGIDWNPALNIYRDASNFIEFSVNFGQRPFSYTPPSGFLALNTQNLPTPTILKGNQYFDINLWTGTGASRSITNSGAMQPDLVWTKDRGVGTSSHGLFDSVRGNTKVLSSNSTSAEITVTDEVTSFNADGFSLGASAAGYTNFNGRTFVGWQWKEGATQGFDIVTGTSTGTTGTLTLAHSLGVAPAMVIAKNRNAADDWYTWHTSLGASSAGNTIRLNTTAAKFTSTGIWGTGFTSSNLLFGQTNWFSASGQGIVAYAFAEVAGFSRFGSYTGNGSTDGTMVFTGFQPRWVMVKRTDTTGNWTIHDAARNGYNASGAGQPVLYPNLSNAEQDFSPALDILSNGFKLRTSSADLNASGGTYVYACFASNPFKNSLAR